MILNVLGKTPTTFVILNFIITMLHNYCNNFSYNDKGEISLHYGQEKITPKTVLVWGGISSLPKASIFRLTGKFDSSAYTNILQQHIIPLNNMDPSKRTGLVHDW